MMCTQTECWIFKYQSSRPCNSFYAERLVQKNGRSQSSMPAAEIAMNIKNIVGKCHAIGLTVLATVCDQGVNNVKAINLLFKESKRMKHMKGEDLFKTKYKKTASWSHIVIAYNIDRSNNIRVMHKINDQHIFPEKMKKMKLSIAAQIFSESVAGNTSVQNIIRIPGVQLDSKGLDTAEFILAMDKVFDSVNGGFGKSSPGKFLKGFVSPKSPHSAEWLRALQIFNSMVFVKSKPTDRANPPILQGWRQTINGFLQIKKSLMDLGFKTFSPRMLNQDPLENFLGQIRQYGRFKKMPNCNTCTKNILHGESEPEEFHHKLVQCKEFDPLSSGNTTNLRNHLNRKHNFSNNNNETGAPTPTLASSMEINDDGEIDLLETEDFTEDGVRGFCLLSCRAPYDTNNGNSIKWEGTVFKILRGNNFKNSFFIHSLGLLKMSFKVREAHWQVLHEEMDKNAVLATGKFVGPTGRENYKKLWDEAAKKVNSLGYGVKSTDKRQKGEHFIGFCEPECGLPFENEEPRPGPSDLQRSVVIPETTEEDDAPYIRHSAPPSPLQQQAQPETAKSRKRPLTESSRRENKTKILSENFFAPRVD
ncbi:hypothetical protein NQ315_005725 [Exocentrus adspersus]|uniref:Transposable element P transposase-like GTP-binding insertion domain-containing protein n=1 Tax=Exocentrus adspersus TaxID=1586481 RepID=A0AAV8VJ40_9CUCU|nr:hypothetical protein NQ315_005725 [Exocentrus adspersus]